MREPRDTQHGATIESVRAKYVPPNAAANDVSNAPAFTLTAAQLETIVRRAVSDALEAERPAVPRPALLDRNGIAEALGCSASQVDKLRAKGMPSVRLGEVPRFELEPCLAWLREQGSAR